LIFREIDRIKTWTFRIVCGNSYGSGILIDKEGSIITCAHVIENQVNGTAELFGAENLAIPFKVLAAGDPKKLDVAILKAEINPFEALQKTLGKSAKLHDPPEFLANGEELSSGTLVAVCGYPDVGPRQREGSLGSIHPPTMSVGLLSSFGSEEKFMISCPIYPGNSGGPVFGEDGKIVGIAVSVYNYGRFGITTASGKLSLDFPSTYGEMIRSSAIRQFVEQRGLDLKWRGNKNRK
jgi:S1-C subfamily serine protease